jgi:predicted PurR-regulated permease PerM
MMLTVALEPSLRGMNHRTAPRRQRAAALVVSFILVTTGLLACGGEPPALCQSLDTLAASVEKLRAADVKDPTAFQSELTTVQDNLQKVREDAGEQWATEIAAVESSAATVKASLQAAAASPSAASLSAVVDAARALQVSFADLKAVASASC